MVASSQAELVLRHVLYAVASAASSQLLCCSGRRLAKCACRRVGTSKRKAATALPASSSENASSHAEPITRPAGRCSPASWLAVRPSLQLKRPAAGPTDALLGPAEVAVARSAVCSVTACAAGVLPQQSAPLLLTSCTSWASGSSARGVWAGAGTMLLEPSSCTGCELWCSCAALRGGRLSGSDGVCLPPAAACTTSRDGHMPAGRPAMPQGALPRLPHDEAPAGRRSVPPRAAGAVNRALRISAGFSNERYQPGVACERWQPGRRAAEGTKQVARGWRRFVDGPRPVKPVLQTVAAECNWLETRRLGHMAGTWRPKWRAALGCLVR